MHPLLPTFVTLALIIPLLCFIIYHGKGTAAHSKEDPVPSTSEKPNVVDIIENFNTEPFSYVAFMAFQSPHQYVKSCFGSIISPNWILTAASCTSAQHYVDIKFECDIKIESTMRVSHESFNRHKDYTVKPLKHNIALIKTEKITFSNTVNKIELPNYADGHLSDENVFYAEFDYDDELYKIRRHQKPKKHDKINKFKYKYKALRILNNTNECTGDEDNNEEFICAYSTDSEISNYIFSSKLGHPLIQLLSSNRRIIIGINIKVVRVEAGVRFLYTNISFYQEWIVNTMENK